MMKWIAALAGLFIASLVSAQPAIQPQPDWRPAFDEHYGLGADQVVRHVAPPFCPERLAFLLHRQPFSGITAETTGFVTVMWKDSEPTLGWSRLGDAPGAGFKVRELTLALSRLKPNDVDIAPELASLEVQGDWSARFGRKPSELMPALAILLGDVTGKRVVAHEEQVEQAVVVVSGAIQVQPGENKLRITLPLGSVALRLPLGGVEQPAHRILDYVSDASGYAFVNSLEPNSTNVLCEIEGDGPSRLAPELERLNPDDLERLLQALRDQTGAKFTLEQHKISRWRLSVEE
ncbi:hypothetical protein BH09PLA1_BH09PLA1_03920 [soil metagenome]